MAGKQDKLTDFIAESNATPNASASQTMAGNPPIVTIPNPNPLGNGRLKIVPAVSQRQQQKYAAADAKAAQKAADQQAAQAQKVAQAQASVAIEVADNVSEVAGNIQEWIASRPTPGGIMVILLVIFIFLWLIVPVNGQYTRAQLLWMTVFEERTNIRGSVSGLDAYQVPQPSSATGSQPSSSLPTVTNTVHDFAGGFTV